MVKHLQFKMVLLLGLLLAGVSSVWAEETPNVTLDFTNQSYWNIPTSGTNTTLNSYTDGTYSIKLYATTNYKLNNGYLILGKKDSYLELPAFDFNVGKIEIVGTSGASASVKQNIYVGSDTVSTETEGAKDVTNTYVIAQDYQSAGTIYKLVVTSAHNTQISKIYVYEAAAPERVTTVTIDDSGITNTDVYTDTAAGSLSAIVKDKDGEVIDGASVTWTSETESVATIANDGTVTLVAAGTTVITASYAGDETYDTSSATYTLTVTNSDPNVPGTENNPYTVAQAIANTPSSGEVYIKGIVSSFYNTSIVGDGSNYRYYISDDGTTNNQLLVYRGKGLNQEAFSDVDDLLIGDEVVIYGKLVTYQNEPEVASGNYIVSLTTKPSPELSFGETSYTCDVMQEFTVPELSTAEGFDGEIAFVSSDESVATVDASTGEVTLVAVGTTTITASTTGSATYRAGSASYTLVVTRRAGVDPVGPAGSEPKYVKVTDTDDIEDGQYLIVYETGAVAFNGGLETLDAGNNVISVEFDTDGSIKETAATIAAEFTIGATAGTVKSASGYYIGITSYGNGLKTTDDDENPFTNSLSIDEDGNLQISKTFDGGTMTLLFNSNSGDNNYRFRFYKGVTSTNKAIQLYKYVPGEPAESFDVTIGATGYKTLVSTVPFSTPEDVTAYIVTESTTTEAKLAPISEVPAGEPVIIKGEGTATMTVLDEAEPVSGNLLKVADETTGNGVYVLAQKNGEVGFYKWVGGSLGAGRVYIDAPANARQFLSFDFDNGTTTGIAEIEKTTVNENVFDLQGRRVSKATKGLYIVNGKKIVK